MSVRRRKSVLAPAVRATLDSLESRVLLAEVAGTLLVDMDATALPVGPVTTIANNGTLGGVFEVRNDANAVPRIGQPMNLATGGTNSIRFDGSDYLQLFQPAGGAAITAPASITGADGRSIEVWVWNPAVADEETMVSISRRGGGDGTNASFNYGASAAFGAVGHWGAPDIGWGTGLVPAAQRWHHLVYTYDGTTTRVYSDGVMTNSETLPLATHPDMPILLAAQMANATTVEPNMRGTLNLAKVRIHDGVLTDAQIATNHTTERPLFVEPTIGDPPPPPPASVLVDITPASAITDPVTGEVISIPNSGPMGGFFRPTGGAGTAPVIGGPLVDSPGGTSGIRLDGTDFLQHVADDNTRIPAPASITGLDPKRSIDVWVYNPSIVAEETMVSFGRRGGPNGSNMSFNYGNSGAFGAVGHWGGQDIGWGGAANVPSARNWHHLAYTYDGTTTRVYVDGVQRNSEVLGELAINTHAGPTLPINIGTQIDNAAGDPNVPLRGSLTLGRVRVYTGVLTPEQIAANFANEAAGYVNPPPPTPVPLTAPPVHRYSFNDPAGDASGDPITDSIGTAHGTVIGAREGSTATAPQWTGSRLVLPGGPSADAPYGDLPNNMISKFSTDNLGTGQISIEGWVRHTGNRTWSRIFDFGFSQAGEVTAPGGTGNGLEYLMLAAQNGGNTALHHVELYDIANNPSNRLADYTSNTFNQDLHFVVTWNEATGVVRTYEQGVEVATFQSPIVFTSINDLNNWLGRSNWMADLNFQGEFDEFRIYDHVLTPGEVSGNFAAGAQVLTGSGNPVSEVFVRGATWLGQDNNAGTTNFMEYLEAKGLGDDVMGYRLMGPGRTPPALNPEDILPWINADQIVVRYAVPPTGSGIPTPTTVTVAGRNPTLSTYTVTSVTQVPGDATAYVLQLNKPLGGGDPVSGAAPSVDENGDYVTLGVSGGGAGGTNLNFRMKVLQGDTDHLNETADTHAVLARDFAEVKKKFFAETGSPVTGTDTDYSPFHDVDGSGSILARDFAEVKKRFFQSLPPPPAVAGELFSATRVAEDVLG